MTTGRYGFPVGTPVRVRVGFGVHWAKGNHYITDDYWGVSSDEAYSKVWEYVEHIDTPPSSKKRLIKVGPNYKNLEYDEQSADTGRGPYLEDIIEVGDIVRVKNQDAVKKGYNWLVGRVTGTRPIRVATTSGSWKHIERLSTLSYNQIRGKIAGEHPPHTWIDDFNLVKRKKKYVSRKFRKCSIKLKNK